MNLNVSECRNGISNLYGQVMRISAIRICRSFVAIALFCVTLVYFSQLNSDHTTKQNFSKFELYKRNDERQISLEGEKQVVDSINRFHRKTKGIPENGKDVGIPENGKDAGILKVKLSFNSDTKPKISNNTLQKITDASDGNLTGITEQSDLFISIKTTKSNHEKRLKLLLETWIDQAKEETFIFTDEGHQVPSNFPADHFITTNCSNSHYRQGLCCKMAREYDAFMQSNKRWFCHVDDDNYVNIPALVKFLQSYNHKEIWYLGRPSIGHPLEVQDRANPGQKLAFWFATGGAGFCISRGLAEEMVSHAGGGRIQTAGDFIRLPDDCTIGYIINYELKVPLTTIKLFHSHLEGLHRIPYFQLADQLTFSYSNSNIVNVKGYSLEEDPTRFRTIHCHLYPSLRQCLDKPR